LPSKDIFIKVSHKNMVPSQEYTSSCFVVKYLFKDTYLDMSLLFHVMPQGIKFTNISHIALLCSGIQIGIGK
jgi:hypothetical protein